MADDLNIQTALGAVNLFMSAVKNCRLYPESSDIVRQSLSSGYSRLTALFYRDAPFIVSEAQGSILFDGKLLDAKSQRMPQIHSLRLLMQALNLKSIVFDRAIDQENYAKASRILSMPPEEMDAQGGVRKMFEAEGVSFVSANHNVFLGAEADEVIERDEDFFRRIWFRQITELQALSYIARKTANAAWLLSVSGRFLTFCADKGYEPNDWDTISRLASLNGYLVRAGSEQGNATTFSLLYESLEALGAWFNADLLALNLSEVAVTKAVEHLDNESFMLLAARLLLVKQTQRRGSRLVGRVHIKAYSDASDWSLAQPRGREFTASIEALRSREEAAQQETLARIEAVIEGLMEGGSDALNDLDALAALPRVMTERTQQGKTQEAERLIQAVSLAINLDDEAKSMAAVRVLLQAAKAFTGLGRLDLVSRVLGPVNLWARYQQEVTPLFESAADMMVNHIHNLIVGGLFGDAVQFMESFSLMAQGRLKKDLHMTRYAERTLRRMASERVFNLFMEAFREDTGGHRHQASVALALLGNIAVPPLLDLLRESEVMAERIRVMGVLKNIGPGTLDELTQRITPDSAWFYLRNLLKLLGEVGGEEHIEILEPLVTRREEQVIDAVISCAKQIGGSRRTRFYSKAILVVPDRVKPRLAGLLAQFGGDDGVYALSAVLKSRMAGPPEEKDKVIKAVCSAMGEIGSMKALPTLQKVVDQKGLLGRSRYTSEQKRLAEETIVKIRHAMSRERSAPKEKEPDARVKVTRDYIASEEFGTLEAIVSGLISGGKKASALKVLLLMVERAAREKDFKRAERYKARLSDVDEMALGEVVRAEEIIDQERCFVDSGEYMETWKAFYELLTEEEASGFYHHVRNEVVEVDTEIITQGEVINRLCFINSGRAKIVYKDDARELFIKEMCKGDVAGYDAFFHTSVCTASVVALSRVNVGYLDREVLTLMQEKYPDFLGKLQSFCGRFNNLTETVQAKGLERRRYRRFHVKGRVVFQLMTDKGTTVGKSFTGTFLDISEGGLSAVVKSSGYSMARLLLGRSICSLMKPGEGAEGVSVQGRVSSVNERGENTISIHVAFARPLAVTSLEALVTTS